METRKVIIISDVHLPYHHKMAWELILGVIQQEKPDVLVCNGDIFDFHGISSYAKDPNAQKFADELGSALVEFGRLNEAAGSAQKLFLLGNHEDRLRRWVWEKCPQLSGLERWVFRDSMEGWEVYPYGKIVTIGKLRLVHDVGYSGVYGAQRSLSAVQRNIATGHSHRMSFAVAGTLEGERHASLVTGWLGDAAHADYASDAQKKDWQLGFGMAYILPDGTVSLVPVPIVADKKRVLCIVGGKVYQTLSAKCSPKSRKISRSGKSSKSRQKKRSQS